MTKHIFITGGVVSSLGKGLTSASIGMLLENHGLSVRMQKLDPYLNVDPGTMSPFQHGEVYVLNDGSETDLDLGHYERFTNGPLTRNSSWTTGKIYLNVIDRERRGEYQGKTVQVVPHVTNEIKRVIRSLDAEDVDVVITEIGGTVGDIEGLPFLEAIRQFSLDVGKENCVYMHLTLVPFLKAARELKTKPTQHSVGQLREIGIQPDFLICRTEQPISRENIEKIALFCNMKSSHVVEERDCELSIYEVPVALADHGLDRLILEQLRLKGRTEPDLSHWYNILQRLKTPEHQVTIAVVGKYAKHKDAYKSVYEALDHAGISNRAKVRIERIPSDLLDRKETQELIRSANGILIHGGFGERGSEGKIEAVRIARENGIPFFGICQGMQCAVIEFARNVAGLEGANSIDFDSETPHPVITLLPGQHAAKSHNGPMRLGAKQTLLRTGSRAAEQYGTLEISERHRHRYEFNPDFRDVLTGAGLLIVGTSADDKFVDVVELPSHPWFVAVHYHPEFRSQPTKPHPLFDGFIAAALMQHRTDGKTVTT
ncbi:MAG: CTP synthase [Planctomycetaceae bacterium]|nr:CTP synthase [Planctomycetaceae bacterium]